MNYSNNNYGLDDFPRFGWDWDDNTVPTSIPVYPTYPTHPTRCPWPCYCDGSCRSVTTTSISISDWGGEDKKYVLRGINFKQFVSSVDPVEAWPDVNDALVMTREQALENLYQHQLYNRYEIVEVEEYQVTKRRVVE